MTYDLYNGNPIHGKTVFLLRRGPGNWVACRYVFPDSFMVFLFSTQKQARTVLSIAIQILYDVLVSWKYCSWLVDSSITCALLFLHHRSLLFVQQLVKANKKENTSALHYWYRLYTSGIHCYLPRASYMENVSMSWRCHALPWRHNGCDGVSNHQPHEYLLNRLFRHRSKKKPKLRVTGLCEGNSPWPVNSPHKGPVMRKMFPFDDVIMVNVIPVVVPGLRAMGWYWTVTGSHI